MTQQEIDLGMPHPIKEYEDTAKIFDALTVTIWYGMAFRSSMMEDKKIMEYALNIIDAFVKHPGTPDSVKIAVADTLKGVRD